MHVLAGWYRRFTLGAGVAVLACFMPAGTRAAEPEPAASAPAAPPAPVLHVVATAHLDTQWLWTIQDTIEQYIPATLRQNFEHFQKAPHYNFSFEGAFRYMLAKEYYPQDYAKLRDYVAQGRWHVCGSSVDAGDVNVPSPESLVRQILYGNGFFEQEFGKRSCDIFLPDCFGFGYALPAVAAHCGLKGFSTQKLTWGSAVGIPFDIGVWEGPDGSAVVAAINPGAYDSNIRADLSTNGVWRERIEKLGRETGVYVGYKYFGVGDVGGAPDAESVQWLEKALAATGPLRVLSAPADRLYRDLTPAEVARLPRYKGELLMTSHGSGSYTSQAAMKRWNRQNELLADAAERASVIADWLGGAAYPKERLHDAWIRFLWHQFHDDLTGTSIPQAYTFSWNDEIIALNQFAAIFTHAVGALAQALDTRGEGVPIVVFNPLAFERDDVVEATIRLTDPQARALRVFGPDGQEVPAQVTALGGGEATVLFLARVPSVGAAVFDARPAAEPCVISTGLQVSASGLENAAYRVTLDANGDVAGVYDKIAGREVLAGPARLELLGDTPTQWSEWEVQYKDLTPPPYAYVAGPAKVRVVERGPVRVAVEVVREAAGSLFIQRISLGAGESGDRIEFATRIDWHTPKTLLKAAFPLATPSPTATYDLGFGVIERPNNTEKKHEVPAQQWADVTAPDGAYGAAVLNDCKYGWDKPADGVLRLTLIHCPNNVEKDMGWHEVTYALCGHPGTWREGRVVERAARLNQPLTPFSASRHPGPLGKRFAFLTADSPQVIVRAVKQAEGSDEVVIRVQETRGQAAESVQLAFAAPISAAREVTGAEQAVGKLDAQEGKLTFNLGPFQPRTFAVKLGSSPHRVSLPVATPVKLPFDLDGMSTDTDRSDGDFDGAGHTYPAELWPADVVSGDIRFKLGPTAAGEKNVVVCRGQTVALPPGDFNRLYVLAAAVAGSAEASMSVGDAANPLVVQEFGGWIGQSDSLVVDGRVAGSDEMTPGFVKRDEIAWVGTHRHDGKAGRNEPYVFCYMFKYGVPLQAGATTVTLPKNDRIRIFAMTAANDPNAATEPARPLVQASPAVRAVPAGGLCIAPVKVALETDVPAGEVVYTLDGSNPTEQSPRYSGPIEITRSTAVHSRVLQRGVLGERVTRTQFTFTEPRPAENPSGLVPGLAYRYYEGRWKSLPNFDELSPAQSGTAGDFGLAPAVRGEHFGLTFSGYVRVPRDGVYMFHASSDDGSRLTIGNTLVVDNDGPHGQTERSGRIALQAGWHSIRVTFFQGVGDKALEVRFAGPGLEKQLVPAEALGHVPAADTP